MTSSATPAEADAPHLSGSSALVEATRSQPPKGGWYQRGQSTFSSIILRYLVLPKFSDPKILNWFFSSLKLDATYPTLLSIITLLVICGEVESNHAPHLGNGEIPNASPYLGPPNSRAAHSGKHSLAASALSLTSHNIIIKTNALVLLQPP